MQQAKVSTSIFPVLSSTVSQPRCPLWRLSKYVDAKGLDVLEAKSRDAVFSVHGFCCMASTK